MELRQLRYFIAVAEERHMTRAAARLGMEQPPLSVQIKALEKELGVPLFIRHARGVDLTAGGEALLDGARLMLATLESVKQRTVDAAKGVEGRIRVGFAQSVVTHSFASGVIRAFHEAYPRVAFEVSESNNTGLTDMTYGRRLDVAMLRTPTSKPPGLVVAQLFDEEMLLALSRNHRLVKGKRVSAKARISLRQLVDEPFVIPRRIPGSLGIYSTMLRAWQQAGIAPKIVADTVGMGSLINLIAAGVGISVVPASMRGVRGDEVVYWRLTDAPGLTAPITLIYLESNNNPAVTNFIAVARKRAAEFGGRRAL